MSVSIWYNKIMKKIRLSNGGFTIVDDDKFEVLSKYKWHNSDGYACRGEYMESYKQRTQRMHRQIMGLYIGDKTRIDHINGDKLDNRKNNLRLCDQSQNAMNSKMRVDNKSGFKGVYFYKSRNKYRAMIGIDKKQLDLGYYETPEEAGYVYEQFALQLYPNFARSILCQ